MERAVRNEVKEDFKKWRYGAKGSGHGPEGDARAVEGVVQEGEGIEGERIGYGGSSWDETGDESESSAGIDDSGSEVELRESSVGRS